MEGADVALVDVVPVDRATPLMASMAAIGQRAIYVQADVADELAVKSMVDRVTTEFSRIDILVNNAGLLTRRPFTGLTVQEWDHSVAVNLRGTFLCAHFVVPHMLTQRFGRIINIASQRGQIGGIDLSHYCASKGGVIAFT